MSDVTYVLVEVEGVEDEAAVTAAIENLDNSGQSFYVCETKTITMSQLDHRGTPVIHFP